MYDSAFGDLSQVKAMFFGGHWITVDVGSVKLTLTDLAALAQQVPPPATAPPLDSFWTMEATRNNGAETLAFRLDDVRGLRQ